MDVNVLSKPEQFGLFGVLIVTLGVIASTISKVTKFDVAAPALQPVDVVTTTLTTCPLLAIAAVYEQFGLFVPTAAPFKGQAYLNVADPVVLAVATNGMTGDQYQYA